jgi:adenylate kinase
VFVDKGISVAVTGAPGTGKTTLCEQLLEKYIVASLKDLAKQFGCLGDVDSNDESAPIDIHELSEKWQSESSEVTLIDGHLSHFLDVDAIVLLRCKPKDLQERLVKRGYSESKITANVEWEMVAGTWSEIHEFEISVPVLEIDTTDSPIQSIVQLVTDWIDDGCPALEQEESSSAVDWL